VVSEGWALYDHVNLQGALERWTMAPRRSTTLVGLTDSQQPGRGRGLVRPRGRDGHPHQAPSESQHIRQFGTQRLTLDWGQR
jgi:hypothetical protein